MYEQYIFTYFGLDSDKLQYVRSWNASLDEKYIDIYFIP